MSSQLIALFGLVVSANGVIRSFRRRERLLIIGYSAFGIGMTAWSVNLRFQFAWAEWIRIVSIFISVCAFAKHFRPMLNQRQR